MDGPISPPPVVGSAGNELPAYMSNGVVGLKVRDNPLTPGMALLSGFSGEHPERKIEAAAFAPYPVAGDICLEGVWMSDAPQCVRVIDQAYDFSTAELTTRLNFKVGGRAGPGRLNRVSASIGGASAGVRLPCGVAAG
jgi:protein-glucosylgalactosylhydroxylysine glucosidase